MNESDDFDAFYEGSFRRLRRYAYGLTSDLDDSEDLVQQAYARAWMRWRSLRDDEEPEAWLRKEVTRLAARRTPKADDPLTALPLDQRRVLVLRFLLDRSDEQIAKEMESRSDAIESWLAQGKAEGIEELLRAMGSPADRVDRRPPSQARQAGAKQLRRVRLAWASLLALAVIAASGGIVFLVKRPAPTDSLPPQRGSVVPLHQIGPGVPYGPGGLTGQPLTAIRQGRAFATWQQSNSASVIVAIDLRTGEQVWRHDGEDPGACLSLSGSDEVLLCGYQKPGATTQQLIAFDSASGDVLWSSPQSRNQWQFGDVVVIDSDQGLIGVNLRTGEIKWTVATGLANDTQIAPMVAGRLVIMEAGGRLRFVSSDTGAVTHETTIAGAGRLDSLAAVDDTAIVGDGAQLLSVSENGQSVVYTASAGRRLNHTDPCGAGHLCVTEQSGKGYDLVVVDIAKKQPLWRVHTGTVPSAKVNSGFYFVTADNQVQVFDSAGAQVESFGTSSEMPIILSSDLVLRMHGDLMPAKPVPVLFTVGDLKTTTSIPIGRLIVFVNGCSPNTTTLVCPTDAGVMVWRYVDQ